MKIWFISFFSTPYCLFPKTTNIPQDIHWAGVCPALENEAKEGEDAVETEECSGGSAVWARRSICQQWRREVKWAARAKQQNRGWDKVLLSVLTLSLGRMPTPSHVLRRWAFFRSTEQDGQLIVGEKGYKYPSMPWTHCVSDGGTSRVLKTFLINERHDLWQRNLTLFQSKCCCAYGMLRDYRTQRLIIKNENYFLGTVTCRVIETFRASLLLPAKYTQFQSWKGFYMFSLFSSLLYILFIFYSFLSSILNYF